MGFITWIVLGLLVGILAKWIMPGRDGGGFSHPSSLGSNNLARAGSSDRCSELACGVDVELLQDLDRDATVPGRPRGLQSVARSVPLVASISVVRVNQDIGIDEDEFRHAVHQARAYKRERTVQQCVVASSISGQKATAKIRDFARLLRRSRRSEEHVKARIARDGSRSRSSPRC